jgi:Uma2 family endonuclease
VFVPDVAFVSRERLKTLRGVDLEEPPFSPDIAVEVRSPDDNLSYLADKIARYLATGSILVLDVDPKTRTIHAHASSGIRTFSAEDRFAHDAVHWLQFDVSEIFAELDQFHP